MLSSPHKRRDSRRTKRALSQLYYYLKHGSFSKTTKVALPLCMEKQIVNLNNTIRRVCAAASPDVAAHNASSAERTESEDDVSASRK
ncbi:hypothetical protein PPTG_19596 [Phytophthora nicotianae INRA-310]|uniref:Uncharacterized protein n=1 Tax=Phytophthora nicotianae (strain INRA-310) TaxID=761204 RepID=W2PBE9_PHYN3|nr:hypothetical protein PPTG_19596 [Phytophthora nicotianae INRA-310]ETM98367.1 hypothetical protein PPTG_19596 [Phytophthora nicotianae INRA-310]